MGVALSGEKGREEERREDPAEVTEVDRTEAPVEARVEAPVEDREMDRAKVRAVIQEADCASQRLDNYKSVV